MDGQQADGTEHQVKQEGVEKRQYNGQDTQADNGSDDAGLHKQ